MQELPARTLPIDHSPRDLRRAEALYQLFTLKEVGKPEQRVFPKLLGEAWKNPSRGKNQPTLINLAYRARMIMGKLKSRSGFTGLSALRPRTTQ